MAEAGSWADRVKQQADIVRVVGDYVRLKKSGQNFLGLCPFHSEKTPSFAVHPVRQIYHCFGCGVGGDVFQFVMELEKCSFPEAVRLVAEKCGIPVPKLRPRSPQEKREQSTRAALIDMHREAAAYFARQMAETVEGQAAQAYLEDRGLDRAAIEQFGLGYAPASGDALYRHLKARFPDNLLEASGLFAHTEGGRLYDRFRRRIMFPIANESGRVIAFGGRALGDELPKYLNSPETPIYSKSHVLYHLDRAKPEIRQQDFALLVEGYLDAIAVARAGCTNVVASCGTSLAEAQVKLLGRFTRRVVVNYDPDAAGQAATERSLLLLLEQGFEVRVLELPRVGGRHADPDLFIREQGAAAYRAALGAAPAFIEYLIQRTRAQAGALQGPEAKLRVLNYLMPYVQRIPSRLLRSEWATRMASELRIEEPVLREALRRAAAERRSQVQTRPELLAAGPKPAERRLIQMLSEAEEFRQKLAQEIAVAELHHGLATEKIFAALLPACLTGRAPDPHQAAATLGEEDRRTLFGILFEPAAQPSWEEAESCLGVLRRRKIEAELARVQQAIESNPPVEELRALLARKQQLRQQLASGEADKSF